MTEKRCCSPALPWGKCDRTSERKLFVNYKPNTSIAPGKFIGRENLRPRIFAVRKLAGCADLRDASGGQCPEL